MRHRHHTRRIKCNLVGVARSRLLYIGTVLFILLHSLLLPASHQDLLPQCNKLPAPKNSENSPALPMVVRPMCRTFSIPGICVYPRKKQRERRRSNTYNNVSAFESNRAKRERERTWKQRANSQTRVLYTRTPRTSRSTRPRRRRPRRPARRR